MIFARITGSFSHTLGRYSPLTVRCRNTSRAPPTRVTTRQAGCSYTLAMTRALFALILAALTSLAVAAPIVNVLEARVGVDDDDDDTLTVLDANKVQYKIRLAGIDATEKDQPFGSRSKQSLSNAVMGKPVRIEWKKQDRYGRLVGKVEREIGAG